MESPRLLRRQDEIGDFPHSPFSTFFLADVPYGLLNLRNAVGGGSGESDRSQRLKIVHIITDLRHLLHRQIVAGNEILEHGQLVVCSLMYFRDRQLLRAAHDDFRRLLRDDRGDHPGLLQQFNPHSVTSIEFLPLIPGLGIIHPGIGQDPIDIRRKHTNAAQDPLERETRRTGELGSTFRAGHAKDFDWGDVNKPLGETQEDSSISRNSTDAQQN